MFYPYVNYDNEDRMLEQEYEEYIAREYEEYVDKCSEDWAYENVIIPEYFKSLEMETLTDPIDISREI